ncbi:MAG: hypothetical protein WBO15_05255 [Gammaproteobacteria bacterium]
MTTPWFIGDELTGAGFRLAGAKVMIIEDQGDGPDEKLADKQIVAEIFGRALAEASLVTITTTVAAQLPSERIAQAIYAAQPPLAVVPDARDTLPLPNLGRRVRSALGVES